MLSASVVVGDLECLLQGDELRMVGQDAPNGVDIEGRSGHVAVPQTFDEGFGLTE